jgi:MtN3 and saliva related transmembrane protein
MNITPDMIDYIGYTAAALTTASFLPQAILTLKTKDTQSLSLGMYTLFTLGVFGWLVYGICIENTVIVFANVITFILAASILGFKIYNVLTHKE